jgi:hypothetical protein
LVVVQDREAADTASTICIGQAIPAAAEWAIFLRKKKSLRTLIIVIFGLWLLYIERDREREWENLLIWWYLLLHDTYIQIYTYATRWHRQDEVSFIQVKRLNLGSIYGHAAHAKCHLVKSKDIINRKT